MRICRTFKQSEGRFRFFSSLGVSRGFKENEKFLRQNRMTFVFGGARKALAAFF